MKKIVYLLLLIASTTLMTEAKAPKHKYVQISTSKGEMIVKLYNETPKHRDNFVKLVEEGFYNNTLWHRVIENFMIQGGDPNSKNAKSGQMLGTGSVDYKIDYEFQDHLFHKKGALAAARDNNPQKASSGCQFYLVQGKITSPEELSNIELQTGMIFEDYHKKTYAEIGGTPFLDKNYTVFGEVVKGMEVIDIIAQTKTDRNDRPEEDLSMTIELMSKRESRKFLRSIKKN